MKRAIKLSGSAQRWIAVVLAAEAVGSISYVLATLVTEGGAPAMWIGVAGGAVTLMLLARRRSRRARQAARGEGG